MQKELFDKEMLDAYIADFPIGDTKITYEVKDAEDKDWNQEWEEQGFEPIYVDNQVVIYDAKHPELYPDTSNRPDMIEIGIEAKLAFGTGNHETTRMIIRSCSTCLSEPSAFWIAERVRESLPSPAQNSERKTW